MSSSSKDIEARYSLLDDYNCEEEDESGKMELLLLRSCTGFPKIVHLLMTDFDFAVDLAIRNITG